MVPLQVRFRAKCVHIVIFFEDFGKIPQRNTGPYDLTPLLLVEQERCDVEEKYLVKAREELILYRQRI